MKMLKMISLLGSIKSFMQHLQDGSHAEMAMKYEAELDAAIISLKEVSGGHTLERRRLEPVRSGITKKDQGCRFEYYVTVNFFENTSIPAEVFIKIAKEGSAIAGFVEALAITISIALQYGVPWNVLYDKYLHQIFEPRDDRNSSLVDAIGKTIDGIIKLREADPTPTLVSTGETSIFHQ